MSDSNLNDASFTPEIQDSEESTNKQTYSATGSFRFWCQKVLPLVYDDSLSYYELLCKVVNYLNSVIQNVDNLNTSVDNTNTAFNNLQNYVNTTKDTLVEVYGELEQYVNDYFNNLDVQEEINSKLDSMAEDGSLSTIISPFIPSIVSDWLSNNITPTSPAIDASLSVSGAGADAKVTGELIRANSTELSDLPKGIKGLMTEYANAVPMTYTINNDRIKILHAFYKVINGYIEKVIILKITTSSISSANTWSLGNLLPYANLKTGESYIDYTATSLSGEDVSGMTFRQTSGTSNNFSLITTGAIAEGQGGVILLKSKQAINSNANALADTEYPIKLINDTQLSNDLYNSDLASANFGWRVSSNSLATLNGYSYVVVRVYGGASITVHGLSETLESYGYAVLDSNKTVLASGRETPGMIIDIPDNGYWLIFTYPTNDNISFIPYFKKKIVVLGDSWSDNNPAHTSYTKWTTLLQQDGRYNVTVYAQNGSWISGDTPDYGANGNVLGQFEQLKADNLKGIDIIILMGGINDYRAGVTNNVVYSKLQYFYNELNKLYPTAKIIYISNNQIYITQQQMDYFNGIIAFLRESVGMECYTSFGWVKANHYASDHVHVDNNGYKDLYANILAILTGGQLQSVKTSYQHVVSDDGGTLLTMGLYETWDDGHVSYAIKLVVPSRGLGQSYDINLSSNDGNIVASVPFTKEVNKAYATAIGTEPAIVWSDVPESFTNANKMNSDNHIKIIVPASNSGTYLSENYN